MIDINRLLPYLKKDDLPERYQEVVDVIGVEATIRLSVAFPGVPLYFKHVDRILFPAKRAYVLEHFTGSNHRRLALETGLPLPTIYDILKPRHEQPDWEQGTLL